MTQLEIDFRGAASKARSRIKTLKKRIARAERREHTPLHPRDVTCPVCGATPMLGFNGRRNSGYCTRPGGRDPLPAHAEHKARDERAREETRLIIQTGILARKELETLI